MSVKVNDIVGRKLGESLEVIPLIEGGDPWLAYLQTDPAADICHHHAWGSIFAGTFGLKSLLLLHRSAGKIDGGVPLIVFDQPLTGKALISMPFLNYGGILGQSESVRNEIAAGCRQLLKIHGADYVELRHTGAGLGPNADSTRQNRITYRLDINRPADDIFKSLRKQLRTRLRRAHEQQLTHYQGRERLDDFYRLFAMAMKEHGTPVMPRRFFELVLTHLGDQAEMMIAYKDGRPVGGKLMLRFKDRATMTWGCYPDRYKHLLANYHLTWEVIRQSAQGPIHTIDFGRSEPGSGGHDYKSNWGPTEVPIFVDYLASNPAKIPNLKPENVKFKMAIAVWKRLPLGITKLIGPRLARYFV
jgi:FemAB-related protein (PEP-CTERM system-associated)